MKNPSRTVIVVCFLGLAAASASLFSWFILAGETEVQEDDSSRSDPPPITEEVSAGNRRSTPDEETNSDPKEDSSNRERVRGSGTGPGHPQARKMLERTHPEVEFYFSKQRGDLFAFDRNASIDRKWLARTGGRYLQALRDFLLRHRFLRTNETSNFEQLVVVIFATETRYRSYMEKNDLPSWMESHYEPENRKIVTYAFDSNRKFQSTVLHEGTHAICDQFFGSLTDLPFWLVEGIAILMETGTISKRGSSRLQISVHSDMLRNWEPEGLERSGGITFKEFLQFRRDDILDEIRRMRGNTGDNVVKVMYSHSWALVYFLWKTFGLEQIGRFFRQVEPAKGGIELFQSLFRSPERLTDQYHSFIEQRKRQ